jgi:hypothetical protein
MSKELSINDRWKEGPKRREEVEEEARTQRKQ